MSLHKPKPAGTRRSDTNPRERLEFLLVGFGPLDGGVGEPVFGETFATQQTCVAATTGDAAGAWIVARKRFGVVDAEGQSAGDDLSFGEVNQRRVDGQSLTAGARFGREVRHCFEGGDVLRTAVGVAAVVERVDADEDVGGVEGFSHCERQRKKDGVSRGHVGDGDVVPDLFDGIRLGDAQ